MRPRPIASAAPRLLVVGLLVFGEGCRQSQPPITVPPGAPTRPPVTRTPEPESAPPVAITSAETLLRAMHDRYDGKWYRTLTFVQKTTISLASGSELHQTWYEAGEFPGKLRIDTDIEAKSGVLYVHDSVYSVMSGKLVRADTGRNDLLLLGFDVHTQAPSRTELILRRRGFALSEFHEAMWQGRPVYVIGAARGDTLSKQFWVDRERLLFVRLIHRTPQGRSDFRFNKYREFGGGWVAVEVEQYVNGKRRLYEEYTQVRTNVALPEGFFDPRQWSSAPHWAPR